MRYSYRFLLLTAFVFISLILTFYNARWFRDFFDEKAQLIDRGHWEWPKHTHYVQSFGISQNLSKRFEPLCDDCYKSAVGVGCFLLGEMNTPLGNSMRTPQSSFIANGDNLLASYGWSKFLDKEIDFESEPPLEEVLKQMGIPIDAGPQSKWTRWDHTAWKHSNNYVDPRTGTHKEVSQIRE